MATPISNQLPPPGGQSLPQPGTAPAQSHTGGLQAPGNGDETLSLSVASRAMEQQPLPARLVSGDREGGALTYAITQQVGGTPALALIAHGKAAETLGTLLAEHI